MVAVSYDSTGTFTFFINGRPAGGGINAMTFTAATLLTIGSAPGATEFFPGGIGELMRYARCLYGPELRSIMGGLAAKRGVQMPQRILSDTPAPLILARPIKGSNIHPKAVDLNRPNAWVGLHGSWDWTWMKRSVDHAKTQGANTIRLVGDIETVASGVITQATYLTQLEQLVDYCAAQGLDYYHCASDATHFGGADANYVAAFIGSQSALLATKPNVIAFEILNEIGNAITLFSEPVLAAWAAQFTAAVRAAAPNLPVTISDVSNGNSTIIGKFSDWQRIRRYAPYVDFFDFHVYPAVVNTFKPWHTAAYELVSDRPVVFGEIGAYRPSRTSAQMTDAYESIRQAVIKTPSVKGVIQWAIVDNDFGLYDETTDTLQTDIAPTWALFPSS